MIASGTNLSMVAGDTDSIEIRYKKAGETELFREGDRVYFSVKKRLRDPEYILQKIVTEFTGEGTAVISFTSEDTNTIPAGDYIYDIQVNFADGRVTTVVEESTYTLRPGVTHD